MIGTFNKGNAIARIGCAVLAILMFAGIFLPAIKLSSPSDYLEDVINEIGGRSVLSEARPIIEIVGDFYDSGILQEILKKVSRLKLSSLGSEADGYGYYSGELEDRMDELEDDLEEYSDEIEDIIESIAYGGNTRQAISRLESVASSSKFQKLISEAIFVQIVIEANEIVDQFGGEVSVKSIVKESQSTARLIASGAISPAQFSKMIIGSSFSLGKLVRSEEFELLLEISDELESLSDLVLALQIYSILYLLLLLLYAFMTLRVLYGAWIARRATINSSAITATVLAVLYWLQITLSRLLIPEIVRNIIEDDEIAGVLSIRGLYGIPAFWLYAVILAGIIICVIVALGWNLSIKMPSIGNKTRSEKWTCSCGYKCNAEDAFCPVCGQKRPEVAVGEWTCTCGFKWEDKIQFCANCGKRKPAISSNRCSCGAELMPGDMFCPNCGKPNSAH